MLRSPPITMSFAASLSVGAMMPRKCFRHCIFSEKVCRAGSLSCIVPIWGIVTRTAPETLALR